MSAESEYHCPVCEYEWSAIPTGGPPECPNCRRWTCPKCGEIWRQKLTPEEARQLAEALTDKNDSQNEKPEIATEIANLIEIVEGVRSVRWENVETGFRLKDTPEWCAFYVASSKQSKSRADLLEQNRRMREILRTIPHSASCQTHVPPVVDYNCPACRYDSLKKEMGI